MPASKPSSLRGPGSPGAEMTLKLGQRSASRSSNEAKNGPMSVPVSRPEQNGAENGEEDVVQASRRCSLEKVL